MQVIQFPGGRARTPVAIWLKDDLDDFGYPIYRVGLVLSDGARPEEGCYTERRDQALHFYRLQAQHRIKWEGAEDSAGFEGE